MHRLSAERSRVPAALLTVGLAFGLALSAAPTPLVSGPRPAVSTHIPAGDRTSPPAPHVDVRFATLPFTTLDGTEGVWSLTDRSLPLRMTVEREILDRYATEVVRDGLTSWNGTDGSTFEIHIEAVSSEGLDRRRRDGVNRVFLDRRSCGERFLARAHLYPAGVEIRGGHSVAWVEEVDIGVCERLDVDRLTWVLRHEVGHVAGLGHLCDIGSDCWLPEMSEDNRCRVMSPASYSCQELTVGDRDGLVYLHPVVPRVGGQGPVGTAAAGSFLEFPAVQAEPVVVLSDVGADADLQAAASVLATVLDAPHLAVDDDCTTGPDGDELNRVAGRGARMLLVGEVTNRCEQNLNGGWLMPVERLPDVVAVARRVVDVAGQPDTVVVVPRAAEDRRMPVSVLAAPVAAGKGTPLVVTDHRELSGDAVAVLDELDEARVAIVLGSVVTVRSAVTDALEERGLRIRRIDATDRLTLAVKVAEMRDVFGFEPIPMVVAAQVDLREAAAVSAVAARRRAAVLPFGESRSRRALDVLEERAVSALVVGDERSVSARLQIDASRRVDGTR